MECHITRTTAVIEAVKNRIATRALVSGDRLPSIRQFAKTMGVSPSTVVDAYDKLVAEGLILSRPGAGFFLKSRIVPTFSLAETETPHNRVIDPFWVSRQSLDAEPSVLKPGCGWLPNEWMPNVELRKALRKLIRSEDSLLSEYGRTRGSLELRRYLLRSFAEEGLNIVPDQLVLTGSGTHAVDLICRLLLRRGDTVLVDDPGYFNFHALLRVHEVKIVGVPYTPSGPDIEAFETIVRQEKPRIYITNSALQNPTGATISPQTAFHILNIAMNYGLLIIEDDIFSDFEPIKSSRLAVLDGLNHVIRIGSFSKTLSASLRCGYIAAQKELINQLVDLQVATNFGGPSPATTEVISQMLSSGNYRKHIRDIQIILEKSQAVVIKKLAELNIIPWVVPRGGFYLWCRLPNNHNSTHLALKCIEEKIIHAPGNAFSISQNATSFIRFNITKCNDERIFFSLKNYFESKNK